jgi:hypothetical protein
MTSRTALLITAHLTTALLTSCGTPTDTPTAGRQINQPHNPYSQMSSSYLRGPRGGRR